MKLEELIRVFKTKFDGNKVNSTFWQITLLKNNIVCEVYEDVVDKDKLSEEVLNSRVININNISTDERTYIFNGYEKTKFDLYIDVIVGLN